MKTHNQRRTRTFSLVSHDTPRISNAFVSHNRNAQSRRQTRPYFLWFPFYKYIRIEPDTFAIRFRERFVWFLFNANSGVKNHEQNNKLQRRLQHKNTGKTVIMKT